MAEENGAGLMDFEELRRTNLSRVKRWHEGFPDDAWTGADWANAMQGEAGEAGNIVKKLRRDELGTIGNRGDTRTELLKKLANEIADTAIYLDLLAQYYGLRLEECIIPKFNEVSIREGFPERLGNDVA